MLSSKRARRRISCVTWSASSRVGHSTMACTAKRRGLSRVSRGNANAAVFPLPVLAWAIRSCPASATGKLAAWMGVMVKYPSCRNVACMAGDSGSSSKDAPAGHVAGGMGEWEISIMRNYPVCDSACL
ncbi:hypothetical protein GALL_283490 [mine drainage metagenome]|uniref:Uncharacterized protein n=1 Tax=mine drainage metagenome TaxID=410659 RepID=A0A1J5RNN9_9ZZZZ